LRGPQHFSDPKKRNDIIKKICQCVFTAAERIRALFKELIDKKYRSRTCCARKNCDISAVLSPLCLGIQQPQWEGRESKSEARSMAWLLIVIWLITLVSTYFFVARLCCGGGLRCSGGMISFTVSSSHWRCLRGAQLALGIWHGSIVRWVLQAEYSTEHKRSNGLDGLHCVLLSHEPDDTRLASERFRQAEADAVHVEVTHEFACISLSGRMKIRVRNRSWRMLRWREARSPRYERSASKDEW